MLEACKHALGQRDVVINKDVGPHERLGRGGAGILVGVGV